MKKEIKSYIEAELRYYPQSKKDIEDIRDEILDGATANDDNVGYKSNKIRNTTQNKAIKLITNRRLKKLEEIVNAIDTILEGLDETQYRLVELKYWQSPRIYNDEGICQQICISRSTYYRYLDAICKAIAIELGLIDHK